MPVRVTCMRMLKLRREAVIKEAVKSDVDPKTCWINKMRKVCFSRKCHIVIGGKGMVLDEKTSVDNEGNSKHLGRHLIVIVLLSC